MSDKVDLGNGAWAKLRDPQDVTERKRRPLAKIQRVIAGTPIGSVLLERELERPGEEITEDEMGKILRPFLGDEAMDKFEDSDDLLIYALVEEWSIDSPITVETIQDLPGRAYDALRDACRPLLNQVLGNSEESEVLDPESPTTPGSV
jgi:hypothetical protein